MVSTFIVDLYSPTSLLINKRNKSTREQENSSCSPEDNYIILSNRRLLRISSLVYNDVSRLAENRDNTDSRDTSVKFSRRRSALAISVLRSASRVARKISPEIDVTSVSFRREKERSCLPVQKYAEQLSTCLRDLRVTEQ